MKVKGVISMFLLPHEVEDFLVTMTNLERNAVYLTPDEKIVIDVRLCVSPGMVDWSTSKLSQEYIIDRFTDICATYSHSFQIDMKVETTDFVMGCLSHRRQSHKNNPDADFFIWLDTDIVFKDSMLRYMLDAYNHTINSGYDTFVITPQIVRQWDSTWDVLVNENYKHKMLNYQLDADIYKDVLLSNSDIELRELNTFKFAGGWFTLLSKKLMDTIPLPESFGHYGPDDTFIMVCAVHMARMYMPIRQFVLQNLLVGEKYKYTANRSIRKYVSLINRKDEFRKLAESHFDTEVRLLIEKLQNSKINTP